MSSVPGLPEIVNGAQGFAKGGIPGVQQAVHDASPVVQAVRGIRAMGPVGMKDVPEIAGRALSAIVPGGSQAVRAGEQLGSGDIAGAAGTAVGAALPLVAGEIGNIPASRLRSPITMGEPRLPSMSEIGQKAGVPIHAGPATAIPYAGARALSGIRLRSPIGPVPAPPENFVPPYLDPQGPASLRIPESYEPPYLPARGPAADDFVPPYLDPHGPFSEAGSAAAPTIVPPSKPTAKGLAPSDIAGQLKSEMESSGTLPKGKGLTPPPADAQPAIVTGQRLARAATSAGIAGDLKAAGFTAEDLPAGDDVKGWQKLFDTAGSPFRKTPEAQRKMIDAVQKEFGKQSQTGAARNTKNNRK
jgi:hypothetical protein